MNPESINNKIIEIENTEPYINKNMNQNNNIILLFLFILIFATFFILFFY